MSVPLLVSAEWLEEHLDAPDVRVADVRWSLLEKDKGRNAYLAAHIPGAIHLDRGPGPGLATRTGPGPPPVAPAVTLRGRMSRASIGPETHVIAYDFGDGSTAARVWWLLRYFGHARVSLLDGGIASWNAEGRPVETACRPTAPSRFVAMPQDAMVVDAEAVEQMRDDPRTLILDARLWSATRARSSRSTRSPGTSPGPGAARILRT
jgi:thiosulfate/3-mercaptopyruvate sulfurtransferase